LTGISGEHPALMARNFRFIGGDTQLLGNFEYRIPIFGPATLALFADVGTVFNWHKGEDQIINSTFFPDGHIYRCWQDDTAFPGECAGPGNRALGRCFITVAA
jgi:hypothetical protein